MSERKGKIQTVLGLIEPSDLGFTQTHEHLLITLLPPGMRDDYEGEPITLENVGYYRRHWVNNPDNLRLNSETDAIEELKRYKEAGGDAIVEVTPKNTDRNPEALARISRETGVHVVMGSGYYQAAYHPPEIENLSESAIAELMIDEFEKGADGTAVKAGLVGEMGLDWPPYDNEVKALRAAVMTHAQAGAALSIHPGRGLEAPLGAMEIVKETGGVPEHTIMCHIERTFFNLDDMLRIADTGCYLEFDLFGQEWSYYPMADIDMPNDATRVDYLIGLIERGFRDKLLISLDICFKTRLTKYGGEGYSHFIDNVLPIMRRKGMSNEDIDAITIHNPAKALAFI
jgi:phosphotriesterase-related protein